MEDLIKRIEAADGPSRELDAEIALAKGWVRREDGADWFYPPGAPVLHHESELPHYTSSIDAAMTLVPEGWVIAQLGQGDDRTWWAELRQGYRTSYDNVSIGGQLKNATPSLALCAAALRASSSLKKD